MSLRVPAAWRDGSWLGVLSVTLQGASMRCRPSCRSKEGKKAAIQPDVQLRVAAIVGLSQLLQKLQVPTEVATMLLEDLEELGAARASELTSEDWASLRVWAALRPLQKRRLLQST